MMRKLLNNPRLVLPLAAFALLWVLVRYEVITPIDLDIFNSGPSTSSTFHVSRKNLELSESDRAVESLIKEQWLPRRWQKYSVIQHEPFVADFVFDKVEELKPIDVIDMELEPLTIPKTAEELESYIVEHLGLDENGFFVRFGRIRKREGDMLRTIDGRELVLGSIALAEERRTEAEHAATIALHLSRMQVQAVMRNAPIEQSPTMPFVAEEIAVEVLSEQGDIAAVAELAAPPGAELTKRPGTFREGDIVNAETIDRFKESQSSASAVISGGQLERRIYRLGDFVQKNPALGLAEVHDDSVQLVDRYGQLYRLDLQD
jgi:hypothetical protein